jgi:predicted phage terminase large subunit-like protein
MYFMGVGGQITGRGINLLVVDDPIKNRKEAESPTIRNSVHEWFTSTALTRFNPEHPPQVIINMARWHDDDLIGRLQEQGHSVENIKWDYMNLEAILSDSGSPLWPEVWTIDSLVQRRKMVGDYDWASLYMGSPMPRDGYVFREPTRYQTPDVAGARIAIGCDPAATAKTSSDYSVITVVAAKGTGLEQTCDILDVWRGQVEIPRLVSQLASMQDHWGAPAFVESVGGFKAVPQMLRQMRPGLRVVDVNVSTDKFTRSLPLKAAWNAGRVRVPMKGTSKWVDEYVNEVLRFTGKGDAKDDQVDATVHAFNAIDQRGLAARRGVQVLQGGMSF